MARSPLFKTVAPPLTIRQRLGMVQQARRALAEREALSRGHKARGLLALHKAEERLAAENRPEAAAGGGRRSATPPAPCDRRPGG